MRLPLPPELAHPPLRRNYCEICEIFVNDADHYIGKPHLRRACRQQRWQAAERWQAPPPPITPPPLLSAPSLASAINWVAVRQKPPPPAASSGTPAADLWNANGGYKSGDDHNVSHHGVGFVWAGNNEWVDKWAGIDWAGDEEWSGDKWKPNGSATARNSWQWNSRGWANELWMTVASETAVVKRGIEKDRFRYKDAKEVEPRSWDDNSSLTVLMTEVKAWAAALHEDFPVLLVMAEKDLHYFITEDNVDLVKYSDFKRMDEYLWDQLVATMRGRAKTRIKNAAASGFQGWAQLLQPYDPRNGAGLTVAYEFEC